MQQIAIAEIVAELERLADDACNRWTIPKSRDEVRLAVRRGREIGYRDALRLLADAELAPVKYATRC